MTTVTAEGLEALVPLLAQMRDQGDFVLANKIDEAIGEIHDRSTSRLSAVVEATGALRRELAAFREQVRAVAVRVAVEQEWCREGLNEVLAEFGLERYEPERNYRLHITVDVDHRDLTGRREDQLREQVVQDARDALNGIEGDVYIHKIEVDSDYGN